MRSNSGPVRLMAAAALAAMALGASCPAWSAISPGQRAAEALDISNLMGRYSAYTLTDRWGDIGSLFALDMPDVRQNVPAVMEGPEALKAYFTKRAAAPSPSGVMHQHAFLSPIIEVAGDGKTAKGAWDSTGADTGSGASDANWAWVRYNVDFIKVKGEWKIWHLRVMSVWRAPYGADWKTEVAKAAAAADAKPEAPPAPGKQPSASASRYTGRGVFPLEPALPRPYQTFDPSTAY